MILDLDRFLLTPAHTLLDAMRCIDRNAKGIALVVDGERRLLHTITDGDLRRAVLNGVALDRSIAQWARDRAELGNIEPKTAPIDATPARIRALMKPEALRHLPLLDAHGRVAGLALASEWLDEDEPPLEAVVMAGGRGRRLEPLTADVPKPMLRVGDRPLMEHIVDQLRAAGIHRLSVTTHYLAGQIAQHFGDGRGFGVDIDYINEERPLGTAGGLGLLPPWNATLLVVNGDVLTRVNYRSMLDFHRDNCAAITVCVREYAVPVPFGVVETDGVAVRAISEKPTIQFFTNAGVYLLEPQIRSYVAVDRPTDMPEIITAAIAEGLRVVCFPISEYWLDIGRHDDYRQAQHDINNGNC